MEYGCIGEKLGHSFSKIIHNEFCDYNYELKEIARDDLADFMRKADFKAINVTVPYKLDVIPFLYKIDEAAKQIGAVNTIVNKSGRLYGYNTDFYGLSCLIERMGVSLQNKKVLILGSGGTSKTALAVAKSMKAGEVLVVSRSGGQGNISYEEALTSHTDAEIIINTTPCGMYPNIGVSAIDLKEFTKLKAVFDAVYNPLSSDLVIQAKNMGIAATGGLYMLVAQAVGAIEKFIGKQISVTETERVYNKLLQSKRNLVLIGMPGCGKTTIGKATAKQLKKDFIDSDDEIVKKAGISIPEIFEKYGEKFFRQLESETIAEIAKQQNCVIATGGGAVLNSRNIDLLKENGTVIFIDRPLEELVTTADRPLSSSRELLEKRYNERYSIYISLSDYKVNAKADLQENIILVKEAFLNENFSD